MGWALFRQKLKECMHHHPVNEREIARELLTPAGKVRKIFDGTIQEIPETYFPVFERAFELEEEELSRLYNQQDPSNIKELYKNHKRETPIKIIYEQKPKRSASISTSRRKKETKKHPRFGGGEISQEQYLWDIITEIIKTKGTSREHIAQRFNVDPSGISHKLSNAFKRFPALEYIIYDSIPPTSSFVKNGFSTALLHSLHEKAYRERISTQSTLAKRSELAQHVGYRNWFALERKLISIKTSLDYYCENEPSEKPYQEFSCPWPK